MFLYHRVPDNMQGTKLYPLSALKDIYPMIYKEEVKKYEGRERVLALRIPGFDCLWNDVLHLTAVHPNTIKQIFDEHGQDFSLRVFEIDPGVLDPKNTLVFLDRAANPSIRDQDFVGFNQAEISKYAVLSEETKQYYKACFAQGQQPLLYSGVAHILYKGQIETKGLRVVSV